MRKIILLAALLCAPSLQAYELAKIPIKETIPLLINAQEAKLELQGASIRKKLVFDIYIGALYATRTFKTPLEALADRGPKRMWFYILHDTITAEQFQTAWDEGITNNNTETSIKTHFKKIAQFIELFKQDFHKGDTFSIDCLPGIGTQVTVNNKIHGIIEGDDFYPLILKTWLGDHPPTQAFKEGLLDGAD